MKTKFTFLVVLFLLTTSIYAVNKMDERNRNDAGNFPKNRLETREKNKEHYPFHRKINFPKQEVQLKSAQAVKQRLDSYSYFEEDDKGKAEFVYDVNGMLIQEREYYWDETTGKMVLGSVSETTYDAAKNMIQHMNTSLDETTNQFIVEYKTTYSYDKNGNMTQSINYYWDSTNNHAEEFKTDYTYDSNGNLIQAISSSRNETISQFTFRYKDDYKYNGSGKETQVISYIWDNYFSKQWEPSSKYESTYDSQGNLVLFMESTANNVNNSWTWALRSKDEFTYDSKGNLTQRLEYDMDSNNQWKLDDKDIYIIDDNGNNTQIFYYYNWNVQTNQWNDIYKEEYTYDNRYTLNDLILPWDDEDEIFSHMLTEIKGFYWDSITNGWVTDFQMSFEYSPQNVTAITQLDAGLISVYPNPFSDFVSVDFPGNYTRGSFELFDALGRKLISKEISNNEKLSLQNLNSGLYLYNLNIDGKIQKGKLVKK